MQVVCVQTILELELGRFLRKKRGPATFRQFSRKLGLPPSTLYRLEMGYQSVTLRRLQQIMKHLNCTLADIFPEHLGHSGEFGMGRETSLGKRETGKALRLTKKAAVKKGTAARLARRPG